MIYNSLNQLNYKRDNSSNLLQNGYNNQEENIGKSSAACIELLILFAFYAVLNRRLFDVYFYAGYGYLISVTLVLFSFILYLINRRLIISKVLFSDLIYMLIVVIYIFISALLTHSGYRYIGVTFNTIGTVIILKNCVFSKKMAKLLFSLLVVAMLVCLYNVTGYYQSQFSNDSVNSNYLAFFGVAVMVYANLLLTYICDRETKKIQIVRILLCIVSFYIIWECQSRGSFLAWIFYVICVYVLPLKVFFSKKIVVTMSATIAAFGVLFSYFYVTRLTSMVSTFMGKSTSTRFRLWSYFWNNIGLSDKNILFGFGTHSELREVFGYGLHNIYIGIWYDIGIIGLLLFMGFIVWNIKKAYDNGENSITICQVYAIIGFLSFMLSDYFAITFTGPLVIWNYAMLGFVFKKR